MIERDIITVAAEVVASERTRLDRRRSIICVATTLLLVVAAALVVVGLTRQSPISLVVGYLAFALGMLVGQERRPIPAGPASGGRAGRKSRLSRGQRRALKSLTADLADCPDALAARLRP